MSNSDDSEPHSTELTSEDFPLESGKGQEDRPRSLKDLDIEALDPKETKQLAQELLTELRRQQAQLHQARQLDPAEPQQAAEELLRPETREATQALYQRTNELAAANTRLENEKRFLSAVMETLPISVAITDKTGGIILTNKAFKKMWGEPLPETRSMEDYAAYQAWWDDTDIPVLPEERAATLALRKGETTLGRIMRIRRFDGAELFVLNNASPVYDSEGNIMGSAVTTEDISELKRIQKALYESEQRLRLFIEQAPVALAVFDHEMRYLSASRRWAIDCGMENRDLTGLSFHEIHKVPRRWLEANRRGLAGEVVAAEEDRYRRFDGSIRWIRWKIHPWYQASGAVGGIVVFTEDITERKKFEQQLRALNQELEQSIESHTCELRKARDKYLHAEKLSSIGKLAASIAHEFKNPLQGVLTILKGLPREAMTEEDREMLTLAISESERMNNLVRNLQELNRPTSGSKTQMEVHAAIHSLLLLCKNYFREKKLTVELHLNEGLPEIFAVPDQINQVLLNLLLNAADACSSGGKIIISTQRKGKGIAVAVTDNGHGIDPARRELIFEAFYSTKPEQGMGLGLAVCAGIIQDHQGEILVESEPGRGSTITVILPIGEK